MIRLRYDNLDERQFADLVRDDDRNLEDNDEYALETAVLISLFTDARADDEIDSLTPLGVQDFKGGWWADTFSDVNWGSKLWTLKRSVLSNTTLQKARLFALESLRWMLDDNVASDIEAEATRGERNGWLCLEVRITRPGKESPFNRLWEVNLNAL